MYSVTQSTAVVWEIEFYVMVIKSYLKDKITTRINLNFKEIFIISCMPRSEVQILRIKF